MTEFVRFDEASSGSTPAPKFRPVWVNPLTVTTVAPSWDREDLTRICFVGGGTIIVDGGHAAVADALADPDLDVGESWHPSKGGWSPDVDALADALTEAARRRMERPTDG